MEVLQELSISEMAALILLFAFVMVSVSGIKWMYGGDTTEFRKNVLIYVVVTLCVTGVGLLSRVL